MKFPFKNGMVIIRSSTILIWLFTSFCVTAVEYVRPSFVPYCITKAKCLTECQCKVAADNCTLQEMTDQLRNLILFSHNQFRDIMSNGEPSPAGLAILRYDYQLEEISRCWAVRCKNEKTECFVTPTFYETSQSVITIEMSDNKAHDPQSLWMNMMNAYLVPAKSMSAEKINTLPPDDIDLQQTAQVFSDRIFFMGCAWSEHRLGNERLWHFVCTYGPRGPFAGESIFSIGKMCSRCPDYYECDNAKPFTRLCKEVPGEAGSYVQTTQGDSIASPPPLLPPSQQGLPPVELPTLPQPVPSLPPVITETEEISSSLFTESELPDITTDRVPGIQRQIYPHHLTESSDEEKIQEDEE
ncbi:hypothetical protein WA026_005425 [Henosepilachna vigintioctopunctata]|uniref:SCP domain-containing protein n=1 Tax=Henosepilachna vigintioctopunctata TaxID=420089 RepID=A0AAW1U3S8_9CUCU